MSAYIPAAKREDWRTPPEVVELVRAALGGEIDLDPCAPPDPAHVIAKGNMAGPAGTPGDGLGERPWVRGGTRRVFVNPPFGDLIAWTTRCAHEARAGAEIVLLMPARTDTRAWHQHVATASAVCLWRGRMTFVGATASCPFPVALVYWGPNIQRFREVFGSHGMVFRP